MFVFFKRCLEEQFILNVAPEIEQIISLELLERTHFQETFYWIDI